MSISTILHAVTDVFGGAGTATSGRYQPKDKEALKKRVKLASRYPQAMPPIVARVTDAILSFVGVCWICS